MDNFEITFDDLKPEVQAKLCKFLGTTMEEVNWDSFIVAVIPGRE